MRSAFVVARQVVSEASRRRLLLALVVLTLLVITLTVWGVSRVDELRNAGQPLSEAQKKTIVSQLLILVMFMFSWVLSLAAVFVASPAISADLARRVRRREVARSRGAGRGVRPRGRDRGDRRRAGGERLSAAASGRVP